LHSTYKSDFFLHKKTLTFSLVNEFKNCEKPLRNVEGSRWDRGGNILRVYEVLLEQSSMNFLNVEADNGPKSHARSASCYE